MSIQKFFLRVVTNIKAIGFVIDYNYFCTVGSSRRNKQLMQYNKNTVHSVGYCVFLACYHILELGFALLVKHTWNWSFLLLAMKATIFLLFATRGYPPCSLRVPTPCPPTWPAASLYSPRLSPWPTTLYLKGS